MSERPISKKVLGLGALAVAGLTLVLVSFFALRGEEAPTSDSLRPAGAALEPGHRESSADAGVLPMPAPLAAREDQPADPTAGPVGERRLATGLPSGVNQTVCGLSRVRLHSPQGAATTRIHCDTRRSCNAVADAGGPG